jgi:protein-export membrane protein SecD
MSKMFLLVLVLSCLASACQSFSSVTRRGAGTLLNVELKSDEPNPEAVTDKAVKVMQNRLNAIGADGEVRKTTPNRLEIKVFGDADMARIKDFLLASSKFELRKVVSPPSPAPMQTFPTKEEAIKALGGAVPADRKVLPYAERDSRNSAGQSSRWIIVENPAIVDGTELRDASAASLGSRDSIGENYNIQFSLNPAGAQKFGDWTGKNINNYLAAVLNDEVKSAAYIKTQIFDQGQIDGRFTKQAAEDLALIMKSGYLPATFQLIDEKKFE